jgi:cytidylate kinase
LLQAPDALVIDSTTMSATEVADLVVERVGGART